VKPWGCGVQGPGVAGRVAAQHQDVADAGVRVVADDVAQFGDTVADRCQVGDGAQGGLGGDAAGDLHGAFA
jgi:hypothetical protein